MVLSKARQKCKEWNQNPALYPLYSCIYHADHGPPGGKCIMTAKNLLEIPDLGAQQCRPERGKQALHQAVFCRELKLAVTYRAKETVESGHQGSGK